MLLGEGYPTEGAFGSILLEFFPSFFSNYRAFFFFFFLLKVCFNIYIIEPSCFPHGERFHKLATINTNTNTW